MESIKQLLLLAVTLILTGSPPFVTGKTLATVLDEHNNTLSILNNFLAGQEALFAELTTASDITVLAPSNTALNKLAANDAVMSAMASEPGMVAAFLKYHVFQGVWYTSNFTNPSPYPPDGRSIVITMMNDTAFTNVTGGQRVAGIPLPNNGGISFISGNGNIAAVEAGDFNFTGGTIHIIDDVLTIPANISNTLINANLTAAQGAFARAGLVDSINAESEITIFAPSNAGFNAVGAVVSGLAASELASVMGYHVVKGKVLYTAMMGNQTETTSEGNEIHIRIEEGEIFVNSARIIVSNLFATNGVVHICDKYVLTSYVYCWFYSPLPSTSTTTYGHFCGYKQRHRYADQVTCKQRPKPLQRKRLPEPGSCDPTASFQRCQINQQRALHIWRSHSNTYVSRRYRHCDSCRWRWRLPRICCSWADGDDNFCSRVIGFGWDRSTSGLGFILVSKLRHFISS